MAGSVQNGIGVAKSDTVNPAGPLPSKSLDTNNPVQTDFLPAKVANPQPTSSSISEIIEEATNGDAKEAISAAGSGKLKSAQPAANSGHAEATDGDQAEMLALAKSGGIKNEKEKQGGFDAQAHLARLRQKSDRTSNSETQKSEQVAEVEKPASDNAAMTAEKKKRTKIPNSASPQEIGTIKAQEHEPLLQKIFKNKSWIPSRENSVSLRQIQFRQAQTA